MPTNSFKVVAGVKSGGEGSCGHWSSEITQNRQECRCPDGMKYLGKMWRNCQSLEMTNLSMITRRRVGLIAALLVVIPLGLASRKWGADLPVFIADNAGDALWTVAVYLTVALCFPRWRSVTVGCVALAISFGVELSQLIDVDWLNALRKTLPGRLLLGAGFLWVDLVRYAVGAIAATIVDLVLRNRREES